MCSQRSLFTSLIRPVLVVVLLASVLATAPAPATAASTYYVSPTGNDANPGSLALPWRTIQHAADALAPGDTCIVLPGAYPERVHLARSGTPGAPLTFQAQGDVSLRGFTVFADHVAIRGFTITSPDAHWQNGWGIFFAGSHARLEDNALSFNPAGGIIIHDVPGDGALPTGAVIRNNRLARNAMVGIQVSGTNHLVEDNEVSASIQHHPSWSSPPAGADADGMRFFGSGHTFRRNTIRDITYAAPENVSPHIDCFQTWGPAEDILFEQNTCRVLTAQSLNETGQGFMIQANAGPVRNLTIRNNTFEAFRMVNAFGCDGLTIVHNTFVGRLGANHDWYPFGLSLNRSPNAIVKNNVFYDACRPEAYLTTDGASKQGLQAGSNAVYLSDGRQPPGSPSPNDLWGLDPRLVDPAGHDLRLRADSPCIDRGEALGVSTDRDGVARPQGAAPDIGAFEDRGASAAPSPTPTRAPTTAPTPTRVPTTAPTPRPTSTSAPAPTAVATANPSPDEIIVDDADGGFATSSSGDAWQTYVQSGGQHYGESHAYNAQAGSGGDIATWSFSLDRPGTYEVFAWWWDASYRPSDVPYTVRHAGGTSVVRVNQQTGGGQWNALGAFTFDGSGSVSVSDDVSSGSDIVADAIRVVYVGGASEPPPAPTLQPTSAPDTTATPQPTKTPKPRPTRHPRYAVWFSLFDWFGAGLSADGAAESELQASVWMDTGDAAVSSMTLEFALPEGSSPNVAVLPGVMAEGFAISQDVSVPGRLIVSFERDEPIQGAGELVVLGVSPGDDLPERAILSLAEAVVNEGATEVIIEPTFVGGAKLYVPALRQGQ